MDLHQGLNSLADSMELVSNPDSPRVTNINFNFNSGSGSSGCVVGGSSAVAAPSPSRYESQKRRDWNTFGQYLRNHRPPLPLARCSGAHVLEFLRYLDQFGKTKVHNLMCPFFGYPNPPGPCPCPLRQAWGSLDALVGRLRAAFEENGGRPESNPFGARAVRLYLREVRDLQSKARGISYEKKKRKKPLQDSLQDSAHRQELLQDSAHRQELLQDSAHRQEVDRDPSATDDHGAFLYQHPPSTS